MFDKRGPDGKLKIVDFGMARWWNARTHQTFKHNTGTIVFNAPEIFPSPGRDPEYNIHADMWSVGVILFMMTYGYPPFFEPNACGPMNNPVQRRKLIAKVCTSETLNA